MSDPTHKAKDVLIVGGGIAGLTLANCLQQSGIRIDLIERAKRWKPVGAGIILSVNAIHILNGLGLAGRLLSSGQPLSGARVTDDVGRRLSYVDVGSLAIKHGIPSVALHRAELHDALLAGLDPMLVNVRTGTTISSLRQSNDHVSVDLGDGTKRYYDLVVGADGIYSQVRTLAFGQVPVRYSGYTCWRFVIEPGFDFDPTVATEMWGCGKRFGVVPIGGSSLYCYTTVNAPRRSQKHRNISVEEFRALYKEFGWIIPDILRALQRSDQLIHNDIEDVHMERWYTGRVVLIGDAAHAMTPNIGQGAAMAIEDGYVLATSLNQSSSVQLALERYLSSRRKRVGTIHKQSYYLGKVAQWELSITCYMRNVAFKLMPDLWLLKSAERLLNNIPEHVSQA